MNGDVKIIWRESEDEKRLKSEAASRRREVCNALVAPAGNQYQFK